MSTGADSSNGETEGPVRANLPDKLIGLGGAGKTIVKEFMQQEWVLEEALEPRDDTDGDPPADGISAYLVDTATGHEKRQDKADVDNINEFITKKAADYDIREDQVLTDVQYLNPYEATSRRYTRLTTNGPVRDILRSRDLNAWWLENNDDMIVDDYSEGVIRRRALSKALFQASQMQNDSLGDLVTPGADEDAALVVGLGGGTGSGMFIDLARELNDVVSQVHLYAIIPGLNEQKELRSNAYAALSELEHLALTNQSPFKNVTLIPFGPTEHVDRMNEFYDGVTNTIVAHYNLEDNQQDQLDENAGGGFGLPDYAPFTFAVPQTLRFEVGDIRTARDEVESFIEERIESLETEHELYDALEEFVLETFDGEPPAENLSATLDGGAPPDEGFNLSRDTAGDLRERLDALLNLLDLQVLHQLDNEAADQWRERLRQRIDNEQASYDDDLGEAEKNEMVVTNVAQIVYALGALEEEGYRDESEERLAQFVRDELEAIHRRANLYRTTSLIDDADITDALENALHEDRGALAGGDGAAKKSETYTRAINHTESNIDRLDSYIEDDLEPLVRTRVEEWRSSVEQPLEQLARLEERRDQINTLLSQLESAIEQAVVDIRQANAARSIEQDPLTFARFDELNDHLESVGLDRIDAHRIRRSVRNAARAHEVWLEEQSGGLLSNINPLDSSDPESDYFGHRNSIDNELISVSGSFEPELNFEIEYVGDIQGRTERLASQRQELVDEVVQTLEEDLRSPGVSQSRFADAVGDDWESDIAHRSIDELPELSWPGDVEGDLDDVRSRIEQEVAGDAGSLLDDLCSPGARGENLVYRGFHDAIVTPVADLQARLEDHLESLRREQERYTRIVDINAEQGSTFAEVGTGPGRPDTAYNHRADTEFQYVKHTAPDDPHRLLSKTDILDANLWDRENFSIEATIRNDFIPNVTGLNDRLPLVTGDIEGPSDEHTDPLYNHHRFMNIFLSRAFTGKKEDSPTDTDVFETVESSLKDGIHVPEGDDGYTDAWVPFGAPWDVSMVSFLGGVFLDNIALVSDDKGYKVAYEEQREELRESVRIRHSHGLDGTDETLSDGEDEGAYLYRDEILQLNVASEHDVVVGKNEAELVDLFRDMQEIVTFPTSISKEPTEGEEQEFDPDREDEAASEGAAGDPPESSSDGSVAEEPEADNDD